MSDITKDGILAVTGVFLGLASITVGLRFYAKQKAKVDDWLMLVALVCDPLTLPYVGISESWADPFRWSKRVHLPV